MKCSLCGQEKEKCGYKTETKEPVCFACCAVRDAYMMTKTGHSKDLPLYLSDSGDTRIVTSAGRHPAYGRYTDGLISNWPGTLRFKCRVKVGRHNIAGVRYDVWFTGPDNHVWHGVQFGDNTQICHCKRTKERGSRRLSDKTRRMLRDERKWSSSPLMKRRIDRLIGTDELIPVPGIMQMTPTLEEKLRWLENYDQPDGTSRQGGAPSDWILTEKNIPDEMLAWADWADRMSDEELLILRRIRDEGQACLS